MRAKGWASNADRGYRWFTGSHRFSRKCGFTGETDAGLTFTVLLIAPRGWARLWYRINEKFEGNAGGLSARERWLIRDFTVPAGGEDVPVHFGQLASLHDQIAFDRGNKIFLQYNVSDFLRLRRYCECRYHTFFARTLSHTCVDHKTRRLWCLPRGFSIPRSVCIPLQHFSSPRSRLASWERDSGYRRVAIGTDCRPERHFSNGALGLRRTRYISLVVFAKEPRSRFIAPFDSLPRRMLNFSSVGYVLHSATNDFW